jgi:ketosteroid isomerase-like protein
MESSTPPRDTAWAMSEENIEIVRRAVDAWNRRDIEALTALGDPEREYVNSPTAVEPGTRHGSDEISAVMRAQWESLTDARAEIDRIYDRGEEAILLGRVSRRMPESDDRLEDRVLVSYKFRGGKIVRIEVLGFGRGEVQSALEAAGLSG